MNVPVDPLEDAAGSPFVRLTGSCTVPESSEVRESSGMAVDKFFSLGVLSDYIATIVDRLLHFSWLLFVDTRLV